LLISELNLTSTVDCMSGLGDISLGKFIIENY
jgi:hypothetical protein